MNMAATASATTSLSEPLRLNAGCGPFPAPGWINTDVRPQTGLSFRSDCTRGLPLADGTVSYAVSIHLLQDLSWQVIPAVVRELRRVLMSGGVLRIAVPDLDRAIDAYRNNEPAYFYVPDADARDIGAKLVTQIIWYGSVHTPFTFGYARELLLTHGFVSVRRCAYRETTSSHPDIVQFDNRPRESLFIEAVA